MPDRDPHAILASVLQTAVDAIILINESGEIQSVNPATERMFGFASNEMLGQNVKMLMPSPYHEQHDGYLKHYHDTGERKIIGIGRAATGQRKDGSTFPLHLAVSEISIGERKLFTGIIRDISDWKAAQAELQKLNATMDERIREQAHELQQAHDELIENEKFAALGRISGGIAHEIRNPLNAIKTSAYFLLTAESVSDAKSREHLTRIDRQVTFIDSVVTALTDAVRLPEPAAVPCDMAAIIDDVVPSVQLADNVVVQRDFAAELPHAWVDDKQIPIALRNLIRNAHDAMPEGGVLTLSTRTEGDRIIVAVRDTGSGIPADVLARIVDPFFSTKAHGLGMGLAIAKSIIEKNRGTIEVETRFGEGTTFSVSLPSRKSASG